MKCLSCDKELADGKLLFCPDTDACLDRTEKQGGLKAKYTEQELQDTRTWIAKLHAAKVSPAT